MFVLIDMAGMHYLREDGYFCPVEWGNEAMERGELLTFATEKEAKAEADRRLAEGAHLRVVLFVADE